MDYFRQIFVAITERKDVDVIYLEFAKAFDKVDYENSTRKFFKMGVRGSSYIWIKWFLLDREQIENCEGSKSLEFDLASGVPQKSVLVHCCLSFKFQISIRS